MHFDRWSERVSFRPIAFLIPAAALLFTAAPVAASGGTPVTEPADFALFAAGVVGLLVGRHSSRKRAVRKADEKTV